jgi:hypothetical protein
LAQLTTRNPIDGLFIGGKRPSRYCVTTPSDADVVKPVVWRATAFAITYEDGTKPSVVDHWSEGLGR